MRWKSVALHLRKRSICSPVRPEKLLALSHPHAVNIDLPTPSNVPSEVNIDPIKNKVIITREGDILWNGEELTQGQLVSTIQESLLLPVEPELQFEPDEFTAYEVTAEVLKIIKNSGATKFGFVGNERYRMFESAPKDINPTQTSA